MSSKTSHTAPAGLPNPLPAEVRQLIAAARQRVASAVNAELTQLYWHIGRRISAELLQGQRGEYGKEVVAELARQLTADFGKGWSEQQLRHCLRLADTFPDEQFFSTVRRELSWSHLKALIYIDDPLKRDFYIEMCRVERWSVRQLQERINSLLYERTAISKKPEDTIRQDISLHRVPAHRQQPATLLKLDQEVVGLDNFATGHQRNLDEVHSSPRSGRAHRRRHPQPGRLPARLPA